MSTPADRSAARIDRPILYVWDGEAHRPANRHWQRLADAQFVIGEPVALVRHEERSMASHRAYFAAIRESWLNLPEELAETYPTAEHLRKRALIATGYRDERSIVCASKAEARRVAAFIKPMDEYAVVDVSEAVVRVYTAQSQSMRAMGNKAFQASKTAVLEHVAGLIGTTPQALSENAGRAA